MSSLLTTKVRKCVAAAAVAAVSLLGVTGLAVSTGTGLPPAVAAPAATMPSEGTLTIHKHDTTSVGDAATGEVIDPAPTGTPLDGVKFDIYAVKDSTDGFATDLDLTVDGDWTTASKVVVADLFTDQAARTVDASKVTTVETVTTAGGGLATSGTLAPRLYLVVEQPNQVVDGKTVVPAQPFLVTVPMTKQDGSGWISAVQVYPKNRTVDDTTASLNPTKVISDPVPTEAGVEVTGSAKGEQITYTLSANVPTLPADNNYDGFVVADKLPAGLSTTAGDVVVKLADAPADAATYDLTVSTLADGQTLVLVKFKPETAVPSNLGGKTVSVEITAVVDTVTTGTSGVKPNTGYFYPGYLNTSAADWDPSTDTKMIESATVKSIYGQVAVTKQDSSDATKLAGAEFQLYRCDANGAAVGDALRFGTTDTFTTNDQGQVVIEGVHLGNVAPGADGTEEYTDIWTGKGTQFCLVETKAPAGYQLLAKPVTVPTLTASAATAATVEAVAAVPNVKANAGFNLPLTGGIGLWLILGGGALALVLSLVSRSRKAH